MNITQRYASAYVVECLTGYKPEGGYRNILKKVRKDLGVPILNKAVALAKSDSSDEKISSEIKNEITAMLKEKPTC